MMNTALCPPVTVPDNSLQIHNRACMLSECQTCSFDKWAPVLSLEQQGTSCHYMHFVTVELGRKRNGDPLRVKRERLAPPVAGLVLCKLARDYVAQTLAPHRRLVAWQGSIVRDSKRRKQFVIHCDYIARWQVPELNQQMGSEIQAQEIGGFAAIVTRPLDIGGNKIEWLEFNRRDEVLRVFGLQHLGQNLCSTLHENLLVMIPIYFIFIITSRPTIHPWPEKS
eukprot:COSAG01_NODE_3845_length_5645_cov_3.828705_3_plen_224_part_00